MPAAIIPTDAHYLTPSSGKHFIGLVELFREASAQDAQPGIDFEIRILAQYSQESY